MVNRRPISSLSPTPSDAKPHRSLSAKLGAFGGWLTSEMLLEAYFRFGGPVNTVTGRALEWTLSGGTRNSSLHLATELDRAVHGPAGR